MGSDEYDAEILRRVSGALSDDQVARFHQQGFISVEEPMVSTRELAILKSSLSDLFARRAGWKEGAQFDAISDCDDPSAKQALAQILEPSNYAPHLRGLTYHQTALAIARRLLNTTDLVQFEFAVLKPAHYGAETSWHQDMAYTIGPADENDQLSIWLPLDDATIENGCMQYLPVGLSPKLLMHSPYNRNSRVHALECIDDFDRDEVVPCPVKAGALTIHGGMTLHYAGPNTTNLPRLAYVLIFHSQGRFNWLLAGKTHPWQEGRVAVTKERHREWLKRGGIMVYLLREIKKRSVQNGHFAPWPVVCALSRRTRRAFSLYLRRVYGKMRIRCRV